MSDRAWSAVKWSGIVLVAAIIVLVPLVGRIPTLSRQQWSAALERWRKADIQNYDMELSTAGAQTGRYQIEVRGGQLSRITRNGQAADPAAGEYWTVDGLFRIIEQDLAEAERAGGGSQMWLRARFDPQRGFPLKYVRNVKGASSRTETGFEATGGTVSVEITVHQFTEID